MDGEKLIDVKLYGGKTIFSKTRYPFSMEKVFCKKSDECPLFKKRECLIAHRVFGGRPECPYGRTESKEGPSCRSQRYRDLEREYDALPKEIQSPLRLAEDSYAEIGDFVVLNVRYVKFELDKATGALSVHSCDYYPDDYSKVTIKESRCVIKKEAMTKELFESICSLDPYAGFGNGRIAEFQKNVIPELKSEIARSYPKTAERLGIKASEVSFVGQLGLLSTLKPGIEVTIGDKDGLTGTWDGKEFSVSNPKVIEEMFGLPYKNGWRLYPGPLASGKLSFVPNEDVWVRIKSDDWILPTSEIRKSD